MKLVTIFLTVVLGNFLFSESLLFKNASVYTGNTTEIFKDHDIYVVDGKIAAIDKDINLSADNLSADMFGF